MNGGMLNSTTCTCECPGNFNGDMCEGMAAVTKCLFLNKLIWFPFCSVPCTFPTISYYV